MTLFNPCSKEQINIEEFNLDNNLEYAFFIEYYKNLVAFA
jgi:hypothetical protein